MELDGLPSCSLPMRRVFLLWLSALLPTLLWAHPEWKEATCIGVIDEKNVFALTVKFDVPSFLLGQLPKDAPIRTSMC